MKKIGLIGGLSFESTTHYYYEINKYISNHFGNNSNPEMVVLSISLKQIVEKMNRNDWISIEKIIVENCIFLEELGVEFIAIASNTIHKVIDNIKEKLNTRIIDIIDETILECKNQDIKTVGLLGTKFTLIEDFMKRKFRLSGIKTIIPDSESKIDLLNKIIFTELCEGVVRKESKEFVNRLINEYIDAGATGIILGCTELQLLSIDVSIPILDTSQIHVNAIIKEYINE